MTHNTRPSKFSQELYKWKEHARAQREAEQELTISKTVATHNQVAHIKPLHRNVAIVEFPLSRGGGWSYYKNAHAVRRLQDKGYKVTWL